MYGFKFTVCWINCFMEMCYDLKASLTFISWRTMSLFRLLATVILFYYSLPFTSIASNTHSLTHAPFLALWFLIKREHCFGINIFPIAGPDIVNNIRVTINYSSLQRQPSFGMGPSASHRSSPTVVSRITMSIEA